MCAAAAPLAGGVCARPVAPVAQRMVELLPDSDYRKTQHFLSHTPWARRDLMDDPAIRVSRSMGGGPAEDVMTRDQPGSGPERRPATDPCKDEEWQIVTAAFGAIEGLAWAQKAILPYCITCWTCISHVIRSRS